MKLGITKIFRKIHMCCDFAEFLIRKKTLGFENANTFLRRIDKYSLIPILKKNGAKIGNNCDIEAPLIFHNCLDYSNLIVGNNCHIGKNCFFDLREKIMVEDNVVISMQTTVLTHQDLNKSDLSKIYANISKPVLIKNNSYIGANSSILMGVILNDRSFIAAGSVVIRDVPQYTMVGGVPAKFIKKIEML
jgi:acetyltransferase-like isoleucine patch superfamily enzyme